MFFRSWREKRKIIRKSGISVYASRKTTLPLEDCDENGLRTAADFNRRRARIYARRTDIQRHNASREWNLLAAGCLEELANDLKPGQTVKDLPFRKRKPAIEMMLRITKGKAK